MIRALSNIARLAGMLPLVIVAACAVTWAGTIGTDEPGILKLVRKNYGPTVSLDVQFDAHTFWSVREREESKSGRLLLAPGDRFRLEMGSETIVSDGATYWQYSSRSGQVVIRRLREMDLSYHPSKLLTTYLTGRPFREKARADGMVELVWSADSSEASSYTAISAWVSDSDGQVRKLRLVDESENVFTYTFRKTVLGKPIAKEKFVFNAPKNAQVLDMRN